MHLLHHAAQEVQCCCQLSSGGFVAGHEDDTRTNKRHLSATTCDGVADDVTTCSAPDVWSKHITKLAVAATMRGLGATHLCESAFAYRKDRRAACCAVLLLLILEALAKAAHTVPMGTVFWSHRILTRFCRPKYEFHHICIR